MPGLVKTKILDRKPGVLQRLAIKVAMLVMASTPDESAATPLTVANGVSRDGTRDHYFSGVKDKSIRGLKASPEDVAAIWELDTVSTARG